MDKSILHESEYCLVTGGVCVLNLENFVFKGSIKKTDKC